MISKIYIFMEYAVKKLLFIAVALLLLGGIGGGAYIFMKKPAVAATAQDEKHEESNKSAGHSSSNFYVELDPLMLPIIDGNGLSQTINMVVVVEVSSERKANKVKNMEPRIKDAYIQKMYGMLSHRSAVKSGVIQIAAIKEALRDITIAIMGDDIVEDVLLQVLEQRRM